MKAGTDIRIVPKCLKQYFAHVEYRILTFNTEFYVKISKNMGILTKNCFELAPIACSKMTITDRKKITLAKPG